MSSEELLKLPDCFINIVPRHTGENERYSFVIQFAHNFGLDHNETYSSVMEAREAGEFYLERILENQAAIKLVILEIEKLKPKQEVKNEIHH